ncbi:glycosyltransferase family 2 protein [Lactiplantibacillus argentoratensis]
MRRKISMLLHLAVRLKLNIFIHNFIKDIKIRKFIEFLCIPLGLAKYVYLMIYFHVIHESEYRYHLSVVCIVKNEAPYIEEWLKYHISVGVEHFYIYDNESDDNLTEVLKKFDDVITLQSIAGPVRQLDAYNDALNKFSRETKYLAMIDADEFLYSPVGNHKLYPIVDKLFNNTSIGGIAVNWVIYGSSGFEKRPNGLVTSNFVHRSEDDFYKNKFIKTICNPRKVYSFTISHAANYFPGYYAVNELGVTVPWASSEQVSISQIRINHYYSKSREEFMKKRARGSGEVLGLRYIEEFDEHDKNDVLDQSMRDYNHAHDLS